MGTIRGAQDADVPRLREIEVRAGKAFYSVGMPAVAEDEPPSVDILLEYIDADRAWVAESDDAVAAYLLADVTGRDAHIAQVSVDPLWRGRGLGSDLVDHVERWAAGRGLAAVTLTTFRDVPWNAPYYRRLGFTEVPAEGPLAAVVALEEKLGLDPGSRVCMRRPVRTGPFRTGR
jgi:GNAT superfamily N-acetyltransferase